MQSPQQRRNEVRQGINYSQQRKDRQTQRDKLNEPVSEQQVCEHYKITPEVWTGLSGSTKRGYCRMYQSEVLRNGN